MSNVKVDTAPNSKPNFKAGVQKFGGFMAGMIIPNIGAILAWGIITMFVIPTGWIPNEHLAQMVDPMIKWLIPILVGYTGGKLVHGVRGRRSRRNCDIWYYCRCFNSDDPWRHDDGSFRRMDRKDLRQGCRRQNSNRF